MAAILRRLSGELRCSASLLSARRFLSSPPVHRRLTPTPYSLDRRLGDLGLSRSPFSPFQMIVRWKTKETRARAPDTPFKSKLKKYKIKGYSSYKSRFKPLNDGTIRRWKEGTRHNAHSKSKRAKRRLGSPGLVPLAYAKVMKKLHFFG